MKLLWHSNAPYVQTGYGMQTGLFAPRLAETHDVAVSAFYGLDGSRLNWQGVPIFPGITGTYGNETIGGHVLSHFGKPRDGLVVTLMDVWVLNPALWRQFNVASWCPVDHDPAPPMVRKFFAESGAIPIAMSRFGQEQLAEFDPLYVPHAVDTQAFQPRERERARDATGLPKDAFVVGVVAANKGNPSRKAFAEILQAFAAFRASNPDALLYMHTEASGRYDGVNLPALIDSLGLPRETVRFSEQYRLQFNPLPPEVMSYVYSSFDVLLNPAKGEGFGIPVLEAQACGVPVIVTDFSAMKEVGKVGWQVASEREWSVQMSWQARPKVEEIVEALEHCHRLPRSTRERMASDAREHALAYDIEMVMSEYMLPALERAQERFAEREPKALVAA